MSAPTHLVGTEILDKSLNANKAILAHATALCSGFRSACCAVLSMPGLRTLVDLQRLSVITLVAPTLIALLWEFAVLLALRSSLFERILPDPTSTGRARPPEER